MASTNEQKAPKLSIFQISFSVLGAPILVVARDFAQAVGIAVKHRIDDRAAGAMLIWNATEEWRSASDDMKHHTDDLLRQGRTGIAHYEQGEGWLVSQ